MKKSNHLSLALAAIFSLGCHFVWAEDIAEGAQTQPAAPTQAPTKAPTNPEKEDTANTNAVEKDAAKPTEEPNCE